MSIKKIKLFVTVVLYLTSLTTFASIVEITRFDSIINHIEKGSLIVLDLDNTVMEPIELLGSDQWFEHYLSEQLSSGLNLQDSLTTTVDLYNSVHKIIDVIPVESQTPKLINDLQFTNTKVVALTTRGSKLQHATVRQLNSINVDFNKDIFRDKEYNLDISSRGKIFKGVIFAGGAHKGDCLTEILGKFDYTPKKVIFVDDKHKNVAQVKDSVTNNNINFIGFRYGYLDNKVASFDAKLAQLQLEKFNSLQGGSSHAKRKKET